MHGRVVDRAGNPLTASVLAAVPCGLPRAEWNWIALDARRPVRCGPIARGVCTADGLFELELERSDELHLAVRCPGFAGLDLAPEPEEDESELDLGALALEVGAILPGRVVDEAGRPIAGAEVARYGMTDFTERFRIDWSDVVLVTSAADGSFQLDTLALGPTELEVRAPGFVRRRREVFADGEWLPEWRVELMRAAPITGRVVGAPAKAELGVYCWLQAENEQRFVACASDGSFVIDGLAPAGIALDLYAVRRRVEPSGLLEMLAFPDWERISPPVSVRPGSRDVELRVPPRLAYRLQVVDALTREPLSEVHVGLLEGFDFESPRVLDVRADDGGVYAFSVLLPGSPSAVAVSCPGYQRVALGELPFRPGETHDFGVVALDRLAPTLLRVVSNESGRPVAEAIVAATIEYPDDGCGIAHMLGSMPARSALPDGWHGTSAEDGTATAHLSPGTDYWISVQHPGHAPLWHFVEVGTRPPADIELRLHRGGAVTLLCLDSRTAAPLREHAVEYESDGGVSGSTETGREGRAYLANLPPGRYRFWSEREREGEVSVQVDEGAELEVTLRLGLESRVRLHGTITEHGSPLVGARVATWGGETATNRDGGYELLEESGEDELVITHPRLGPIWAQYLELTGPETRVDVDLTPARLQGVVRDEGGLPLAGALAWIGTRLDDGRFEALGTFEGPLHATESAADGSFAFSAVQPRAGLYLLIEKPGFHTERFGPLVLPRDGSPLAFQPELERAVELEVIVQDLDVSAHVIREVVALWRGAVELAPDDGEVRAELVPSAGADRHYRFTRLRPGPWVLEVHDYLALDDRPLARGEVTLAPTGNAPVVLRP